MTHSVLDLGNTHALQYIITHVFCPLKLPDEDDHCIDNDCSLATAVSAAARLYSDHVSEANVSEWHIILRMLDNLRDISRSRRLDMFRTVAKFNSMHSGDVLALPIRAQNAGVIFRKHKDVSIFEAFEVSPRAKDVMAAEGKLICSYPGPAIEIPNTIFDDASFRSELVNFLTHMNEDDLDPDSAKTPKKDSPVFKDTAHPRYITELLTGILRGIGRPADIPRISKRVGDDVVCSGDMSRLPWRRSSLWLLIRVVLQTTLHRSLGHHTYKEFVLFFMCCLPEKAFCGDLPNDLLHFMSAKLSRRLWKLGSTAPDWLSRTVLEVCTRLRSVMEDRWRQVRAAQHLSRPPWDPYQLDLVQDTQLTLLRSGSYIRDCLARENTKLSHAPFHPTHPVRGSLDDFLSSQGEFFENAYRIQPHVALYDVERTVQQGIDAWVNRVTNNDEACENLEILAHKYSSSALKTYPDNPELLSVMFLTTIELWIALDKIVTKEIPILADYSPEVPISLLENLLLCTGARLDRLHRAHEYISRRHSTSRRWSVFSPQITSNSFAVRYYKKSSHLRHLKARIEGDARQEIRERLSQLRNMNAYYKELLKTTAKQDIDRMDMKIQVHEWPLPANKLDARVVVFELDCPVSFNMWRSATFYLLVKLNDPLKLYDPFKLYGPLNPYDPLEPYLTMHPRSRISFSFSSDRSAPPTCSIPAKQGNVLIKNRRRSIFAIDMRTGAPASEALGRSDNKDYCTYKLQSGSYHNLQKYVGSTSHTSNEIIANQTHRHEEPSIHEYIAFGHLRSGSLLQWLNILRALRGRSLSFRRQEVHMLIAQAISQVGPLVNGELAWHQETQCVPFCHALLGELRNLIQDIEANWLEVVTMDTISLSLRRLLVTNPDQAVSAEALSLLRTVRDKVFAWIQELSARLVEAPGDEGFRGALRDTAAICRSTFDVDPIMIPRILRSAEDLDIFLSSVMMIHAYTPTEVSQLTTYSRLLIDRNRHLSLVLQSVVTEMIQADSRDQGINLAIRRIWPGYHPGSKWQTLGDPDSCWLSCRTEPPAEQSPQVVYLNILDGSLLVNGKPLRTWLPNEFKRHPLYNLVIGEQMLEVLPSGLPGMDYSTRELIAGHRVFFSLRNHADLVIRAIRKQADTKESEVIEFIPHDKLEGDLPVLLIEGYAHWLNLSTSVMEIRPLSTLWETSLENWKVNCIPGHFRMWKGQECLVDIRSKSWEMVSGLVRSLCSPQDLIVSVCPVDTRQTTSPLQLFVYLSRYDLSFFVDEDGDLQSRNIRGMVYDENQCIGTLFGLVNKLVLRPKIRDVRAVELDPRCVLIPEGEISFHQDDHHRRVKINTEYPSPRRITYQTYRVDTLLGRLTGNGSLTSKLYSIYLHALTSGWGLDPLTGRAGIEEALSLLQSACSWSTMRFSSRDAELLELIASICPLQTWYSDRSMQKTKWEVLPANPQNFELFIVSKAIKERYGIVQASFESQTDPLFHQFPLQDDHLLRRSARRAARIFPSEAFSQPFEANIDVRNFSRDQVGALSGEPRAYITASSVYCRTVTDTRDVCKMVLSWRREIPANISWSLQYSKSWLAPDLPSIWLTMYNLLRQEDESKWFRLLFSLPAMACGSKDLYEMAPTFIALASHSEFRYEDPPPYGSFPLSVECFPSREVLHRFVVNNAYPFTDSPEGSGFMTKDERPEQRFQRRKYEMRLQTDAAVAVQRLLNAWPCEIPPPCSLDPDSYDLAALESDVEKYFSVCFRMIKLKEHLTRVQIILNNLHSKASPTPDTPYVIYPSDGVRSDISRPLSVLEQPFTRPVPSLTAHHKLSPQYAVDVGNPSLSDSGPLHQLIFTVEENATSPFQHRYVSALRTSAASEVSLAALSANELPNVESLIDHYTRCRTNYTEALYQLQRYCGPMSESEQAMEQSGQWPRITAYTLFRCLASNSPLSLSNDWKRCLIKLALLALGLQRARRLLLLYFSDLHEELWRELQNEGCDGWDAEAHPDWLLIQLEGDFLIRPVQVQVANEMMSPRSGENTAMQLNMGEGKSSVIVPIIAAVLADGDQLVRVIVPKPLVAQTFQILVDRLGGLTNRRIHHLSFSRSFNLDHEKAASLHQIMLRCMQGRGILILQPEHVLSLRLMSVEGQLSQAGDRQLADPLLKLQVWLHCHSRDILDESDRILEPRYQLAFTVGRQQHVDGSPERWTTTQQILGLVGKHAASLRTMFPLGVEYEPGPFASFPYLRILHADAGQKLISWIVQDILDGLLPSIQLSQRHLRSDLRSAVRSFWLYENPPRSDIQLVAEHYGRTPLWGTVLLLRGLLAHGILLFVFRERRWRVDYGLHPTRTMLAVPYTAKDVPAQRADFGHPDVAITLTCLSYYYGGLSEEHLKHCFDILFKQHDPSSDYNLWVRDSSAVPDSLRALSGINIESAEQWNKFLFPLFSRNRATVDFYLARVVFPREAKEFPSKLSTSGWDLAEKKDHPLTGFSGTNDIQCLLPLHITQRDPDHQRGTNAKVLSCLLQPENKHYLCMAHENGERRTSHEFLQLLVAEEPEIRVLLDVGAQILDLRNHELAQVWLSIDPVVSAAVYFNEDDELIVLTRNGVTQLLQSSPFAQQLDKCVVYLDDAHTRGIDIKFPIGSRAAVTLGPKVTKDRLAQGCMRMRKLGHGHSVMFFAPLEVDQQIRFVAGKRSSDMINTMDILHWAIRETWEYVRRWAPHWLQQGIDHTSRYSAWSDFCRGQLTPKELSDKWLQPEAKTLQDLYEPRAPLDPALLTNSDIHQRCIDLGVSSLCTAGMDEEQERELLYETEIIHEQQTVEPPLRALPAAHSIDKDVLSFVRTGVVPRCSRFLKARTKAFIPAFDTLSATSAAFDEAYIWSESVLVTKDFERTVKSQGSKLDNYMRPVHWIATGFKDVLVILSPYEVNTLLPEIKSRNKVRLHLYSPRITESMKPCDDLSTFYSIPAAPKDWIAPSLFMHQLNVFSGQLYFKDYEAYVELCRFLCVYVRDPRSKERVEVEPDGFIIPGNRTQIKTMYHTFMASPLPAIKTLMSVRNRDVDFSLTHMGKLIHGHLLSEADFHG